MLEYIKRGTTMNVYDFDKTIYWHDCATHFYKYVLKKKPSLSKYWPKLFKDFLNFKLKRITRTQLKETLYQYVIHLDILEELVDDFWFHHEHLIKEWYLNQKQPDDLIISASPEFLIKPICDRLGVKSIASRLNPKTGTYEGVNCFGEEKVVRYKEEFNNTPISEFYSDSLSDTPMAKLAAKAYVVEGQSIREWPQEALVDTEKRWD